MTVPKVAGGGTDNSTKPASAHDLNVAAKLGPELAKVVANLTFGEPNPAKAPREVGGSFNSPTGDPLLQVRINAPNTRLAESDFRHNYVLVNPRTNEFYAMPKSDITGATWSHGPQKLPKALQFSGGAMSDVALTELQQKANTGVPSPQSDTTVQGNQWGGVNRTGWR